MRLNPDCIRDILLLIEEKVDNNVISITESNFKTYAQISKYDYSEIAYHIKQVWLANLVSEIASDMSGNFTIFMLTPAGHEFLENIRVEENWNQTKNIAKNVGSYSITALKDIATNVISAAVTAYLMR